MKKILTVMVAVLMFATSAMAQLNVRPSNQKTPINAQQSLKRAVNGIANKLGQKTFKAANMFNYGEKSTFNLVAQAIGGTYYDSDNDWFIVLTCEGGIQYSFDIVANNVVAGTTYTLTDMMEDYTGQRQGYDYDWNATEASFTCTANLVKDAANGITCPGNVTASLTSPDGNVYNITYTAPTRPETFTDVTALCNYVMLDDNTSATDEPYFMFTGMNDTLTAQVSFNVTSIPGTYYYNDIDPEYTALSVNGEELVFDSLEFVVTASTNPGEYDATLMIGAFNGIHYTITMNYRIPTAQTTETVNLDNLTIDDSYASMGILIGMAEGDDYAIQFYAFGEGQPIDANYINFYAYDQANGGFMQIPVYSSNLIFNDRTSVTGSILCYNNIQYNITLTGTGAMQYDETEADFNETYTANEVSVTTDYISTYGLVLVQAQNATSTVAMYMYVPVDATDLVAGTYEVDETETEFTVEACPGVQGGSVYPSYAGYTGTQGLTNVWFMRSGTVTVTANSINVNAVNSANRTITAVLPYSSTQGINEVNNESISIYPNPVSSTATINVEGLKEVSVLDVNGRVVMTQTSNTIDMSNLSNGIYMVRMITNNGTSVQKIVKK